MASPFQGRTWMSGIFISYRREDSADDAHRLYGALSAQFGADSVFIDVEDIDPGEDFAEVIDEKVGFCDALIAVIGKTWLTCADAHGIRRLDNSNDWVRLEIESALSRNLKVVPVIVGGASPPGSPDLPPSLAPLSKRNAIAISASRFHEDASRLVESLAVTLDLRNPALLWRALRFLVYMAALSAAIHWPIMTNLWSPLRYAAGECIQYLGTGFVLHFTMAHLGGRATLQKSIATMCFLTAYVPLIGVGASSNLRPEHVRGQGDRAERNFLAPGDSRD
jgi:hypothetical protein